MNFKKLLLVCGFFPLLISCISHPPRDPNNICRIFKQYPNWYWDTQDVARRWKIPIAVQMAIIHQESKFVGNSRPRRTKLLWVIPWKRPSTAYGYSQALSSTWKGYKKDKNGGNFWASRDTFSHTVDFIGWYADQVHRRIGISRDDAYRLYLAYHEGAGGYERQTYLQKPWLVHVARKVQARSYLFQLQLDKCKRTLPVKPWYKW
jgi:hypothetical protein